MRVLHTVSILALLSVAMVRCLGCAQTPPATLDQTRRVLRVEQEESIKPDDIRVKGEMAR
jgi:hypothetical protein